MFSSGFQDSSGTSGLPIRDIHVGFLQQDIAFDQQFLARLVSNLPAKELNTPVQDIVVIADRIEGDVAGHDLGRFPCRRDHHLQIPHAQRRDPAIKAVFLSGLMDRQDAALEHFQRDGDGRRALVMFAVGLVGRGKDAVAALVVDNPPVLDHSAFREDDNLAAAQDLGRQEGQKARMIVRHGPHTPEEFGKGLVA